MGPRVAAGSFRKCGGIGLSASARIDRIHIGVSLVGPAVPSVGRGIEWAVPVGGGAANDGVGGAGMASSPDGFCGRAWESGARASRAPPVTADSSRLHPEIAVNSGTSAAVRSPDSVG
jgi:hypothetical protein